MILTRLQRRNLAVYQRYRGRRMTILGLFWSHRRLYVLTVALFAVFDAVSYALGGPYFAALMAAFFLGALLRDVGYFRRSAGVWSLLEEIIDWDKVDALLREDAAPKEG